MLSRTSNCRFVSPRAGITISRSDRDVLQAEVLTGLSELREIPTAIARGDFEKARRLRCRLEREMRLLDDLGWNPHDDGERFALTMSGAELIRTVHGIGNRAGRRLAEPSSTFEAAAHNLLASAACHSLLDQLADMQQRRGSYGQD